MNVKCVLCDTVEDIDSQSLEAKRLRNRRIHMYLCDECDQRIGKKTKQRHATGNFKLYEERKKKDSLI
ncbi:YlaI family protein [Virgibacillus siamensis]|uniref:YlaI family protein n=1 Tax=Virgibacillus siamensis TaxID=480071 RepID=UPI0009854144|nr:YlaI family protein [Virgibacillus siamensis]